MILSMEEDSSQFFRSLDRYWVLYWVRSQPYPTVLPIGRKSGTNSLSLRGDKAGVFDEGRIPQEGIRHRPRCTVPEQRALLGTDSENLFRKERSEAPTEEGQGLAYRRLTT